MVFCVALRALTGLRLAALFLVCFFAIAYEQRLLVIGCFLSDKMKRKTMQAS